VFSLGFNGVRVARFLVFCVVFRRLFFVLLPFFLWQLYCLSFELRLPFTPLAIVLSVLRVTSSVYTFGNCIVCRSSYVFRLHLWQLYCLSFELRLPITPLTSSNFSYTLFVILQIPLFLITIQ